MKITLHIPVEQYGFISAEYEIEKGFPPEKIDVARTYRAFADAFKEKEGLTEAEMDELIENMVRGNGKNHIEMWERATFAQKTEANRLKRAIKRINRGLSIEKDSGM